MREIKWSDLSSLQQGFLMNLAECHDRLTNVEFVPFSALKKSKGGTRQSLVYKGLIQRAQIEYGFRYKLTDAGRALLPASDELAPAQPATADAGVIERETDERMQHNDKRVGQSDDYAKGYDAGLLDGYAGVDADWVARFEAQQADLQAKLAAAEARADAAETLLENLEMNLPRSEPNPNSTGGNYSRAYSAWTCGELIRAYQKQANG